MASSVILHNVCSISLHSQFLSSKSFFNLNKPSLLSNNNLRVQKSRSPPIVFAAQSNFLKVIQTAWKVGKDGVEAGTNLVPDSVPRPIARISVTVVALTVSLFVLSSFLSTAFFALATMGLIYFAFIAMNKDEGPKGGGGTSTNTTSTEDSLEEARKIMEKYK
ncbi:Transmembrane protein [Fagus crenata]